MQPLHQASIDVEEDLNVFPHVVDLVRIQRGHQQSTLRSYVDMDRCWRVTVWRNKDEVLVAEYLCCFRMSVPTMHGPAHDKEQDVKGITNRITFQQATIVVSALFMCNVSYTGMRKKQIFVRQLCSQRTFCCIARQR